MQRIRNVHTPLGPISRCLQQLGRTGSLLESIKSSSASNNAALCIAIKKDQTLPVSWWEEATVYVHWPYCKKRCSYCNFNKYVVPNIDQDRMRDCLVAELQTLVRLSGVRRISSIFFGGGTPSLAEPWVLGAVIDAAAELVAMPTDVEITMEANPTSGERKKLKEFKSFGINRLSLGIQALNDSDLKSLGREHTVDQSLACIREAKKLFPNNLNLDLIFGRPYQTLQSWEAELDGILDICDDHVSLYQLTLEPGTLLYKLNKQGVLPIPDADSLAEMYETAVRRLALAGLHRYEVSNFARSVHAESKHNKAYWEGRQYIGVGPGAHGRFYPIREQQTQSNENKVSSLSNRKHLTERSSSNIANSLTNTPDGDRCVNVEQGEFEISRHFRVDSRSDQLPLQREARIQTLEPEAWMCEVENYGHGTRRRTLQSSSDVLREMMLMGLRIPQGVSSEMWSKVRPDVSLVEVFGTSDFVREAIESSLLELDNRGIRCTDQGLNVLDSLMPHLVVILDSYHT